MELGDKLVEATDETVSGRKGAMRKALRAKWSGLLVFVSKETKEKLEQMIGEPVTKQDVREFIEGVANGEYLVTPRVPKQARRAKRTPSNGAHSDGLGNGVTADAPILWTMQQVAKALGVEYGQIYTRAQQGRIHTVREGKRYLVPSAEVVRLQSVGL